MFSFLVRSPTGRLCVRVASGFAIAILFSACTETLDNIDSRVACSEYCSKSFQCDGVNPSRNQTSDCVRSCRSSIEEECGNVHQAAANDAIRGCVDYACTEFAACMVFDAAPECFAFVTDSL